MASPTKSSVDWIVNRLLKKFQWFPSLFAKCIDVFVVVVLNNTETNWVIECEKPI